MKTLTLWSLLVLGWLVATPLNGGAEDMRAVNLEARKEKAALLEKAEREEAAATKEAAESRARLLADKQKLKAAVLQLKKENARLAETNKSIEKEVQELSRLEEKMRAQLKETDAVVRELAGLIRTNAKDLETLISASLQSPLVPGRSEKLQAMMNQNQFPGMDDIRCMVDMLFDEIRRSGEVRIASGSIVDRAGEETAADILLLGNFTAAYRIPGETGFLLYSDKSDRFFALSNLPAHGDRRKIEQYMAGTSEDVPVDISRGGALKKLTHHTSLWKRIENGGPIVWPILGIGLVAALVILERFLYLFRMNINADQLMQKIIDFAGRREWDRCLTLCRDADKKPVPKVLAAGIRFREASREDMENVLQEAILREIPRLERFLSLLGMLAAIAPLLGLLGTVTGMINTFHVITFYGTGDPRMMSGGISEALVTTMLGLTVAIPIMLGHTLLSRRVETIIGQMEEKSVALTNLVFKNRNGEC